jgi:hypothetical protein
MAMDPRKLGSILNNDINNILYAISTELTAPQEYSKAVGHLLDTEPGVLAQNVGMPDPVLYPSDVATSWEKYHAEVCRTVWPTMDAAAAGHQGLVMRRLREAGTDPLTLTIQMCRQRQVPVVASYRMNAEDMYRGELDMYDFGRGHRELAIPGANCLDPVHPEVFEHRMRIFGEVVRRYDIDGIEFDFRRWTHMVSEPRRNHPVLTAMVRQTRQLLDQETSAAGRQRLLLGVRVAPTLSGPPHGDNDMSCAELGLDVETWIREELVDYLCPSFFWGHNPGDDPSTAEFVELTKGRAVGVYPTVFPYSKWQALDVASVDLEDEPRMRRYRDDILEAALKCYAEGADGISTYNWVPHQQPGMTGMNIREDWGLGAARLQMHIHALLKDRERLEAYYRSGEILPA